jgi:hypothetical protein
LAETSDVDAETLRFYFFKSRYRSFNWKHKESTRVCYKNVWPKLPWWCAFSWWFRKCDKSI